MFLAFKHFDHQSSTISIIFGFPGILLFCKLLEAWSMWVLSVLWFKKKYSHFTEITKLKKTYKSQRTHRTNRLIEIIKLTELTELKNVTKISILPKIKKMCKDIIKAAGTIVTPEWNEEQVKYVIKLLKKKHSCDPRHMGVLMNFFSVKEKMWQLQ